MIGLLASTVNMLGTRMATGANNTISQNNEEPGPFDGRLVTATSDFMVTDPASGSNYLEYVEYRR